MNTISRLKIPGKITEISVGALSIKDDSLTPEKLMELKNISKKIKKQNRGKKARELVFMDIGLKMDTGAIVVLRIDPKKFQLACFP